MYTHMYACTFISQVDVEAYVTFTTYSGREARLDKANIKRLEAAEEIGADACLPGREVSVKDLNNVVMRDIGDRIQNSKKWVFMVDPGDFTKKLITYAGCVVLSFWKADEMEPERIRTALLTQIRAGGVLAIDLFMFATGVSIELLAHVFNEVRPWLFESLMNRELLTTPKGSNWPKYRDLVV